MVKIHKDKDGNSIGKTEDYDFLFADMPTTLALEIFDADGNEITVNYSELPQQPPKIVYGDYQYIAHRDQEAPTTFTLPEGHTEESLKIAWEAYSQKLRQVLRVSDADKARFDEGFSEPRVMLLHKYGFRFNRVDDVIEFTVYL